VVGELIYLQHLIILAKFPCEYSFLW